MPTYVYRREDGTTFEIEQRITDPPLKRCPTTDQKVTRLITGHAGLVFKGSGFYITDYARSGNGSAASSAPAANKKQKDAAPAKASSKDEASAEQASPDSAASSAPGGKSES